MAITQNSTQPTFSFCATGQQVIDQKIEALDPLHIDDHIHVIPKLNRGADINGLSSLLFTFLPTPLELERFSYYEAAAAMRDIGFFLGSLKKHGEEPLQAIPELEYVLEELGNKTNLPPRDTLIHYTVWNPSDSRRRTYTGTQDEIELIESVKISTHPLFKALENLLLLQQMSPEDPGFKSHVSKAGHHFQGMVDGIVHAYKKVSPEYFAKELRLYFDSIQIFNKPYIGPGAVEMPVFVYDHLLWSSDVTEHFYVEFKHTYLPFILPELRDIFYHFEDSPSLITKMIKALKEKPENLTIQENSKALLSLCTMLKSFRTPHKKMADKSYEAENGGSRDKGSGGYSTDILAQIIEVNNQSIQKLQNAIKTAANKNFNQERTSAI